MKKTNVYNIKPSNFIHELEASGCYIEFENKLLYLKKAKDRWGSLKWTIPGGKKDTNESAMHCIQRELFEEIGIDLKKQNFLFLGKLYVMHLDANFLFYIFYYKFEKKPKITLSDEHVDYIWIEKDKINSLDTVPGGKKAFNFFIDNEIYK